MPPASSHLRLATGHRGNFKITRDSVFVGCGEWAGASIRGRDKNRAACQVSPDNLSEVAPDAVQDQCLNVAMLICLRSDTC